MMTKAIRFCIEVWGACLRGMAAGLAISAIVVLPIFVLLLLLFPALARAAPTVEASYFGDGTNNFCYASAGFTSMSCTLTTGAAPTALIVGAIIEATTGTSIFNGASCDNSIGALTEAATAATNTAKIYVTNGQTIPANTAVTCTVTDTVLGDTTKRMGMMSLTGSATTSIVNGSPGIATGNSTTPSVAVTTGATDLAIDMVGLHAGDQGAALTVTGSQTEIARSGNGTLPEIASGRIAGTGGSVTFSWAARFTAHVWEDLAISVKPAAAGPTSTSGFFQFMQ